MLFSYILAKHIYSFRLVAVVVEYLCRVWAIAMYEPSHDQNLVVAIYIDGMIDYDTE